MAPLPAIEPPMSEAMRALHPRARKFVQFMTETGGNVLRSALMAGAGSDSQSPLHREHAARTAGYRWMQTPKVLLALKEAADATLRGGAIEASQYMRDLVTNPKAKDNDRLRAANRLLELAGLGVVQQIKVDHRVSLTREEGIARVMEIAPQLKLDPVQLLGSVGITIDAEFEDVVDVDLGEWEETPDVDETW